MSKEIIIYEEKYHKPYPTIRETLLPETLPYFAPGIILTRM